MVYPFLLRIYEGRKLSYQGDWWHLEIVGSHPLNYGAWVTSRYYSSSLSETVLAQANCQTLILGMFVRETAPAGDLEYTKHLGQTSQQWKSCWLCFRVPIPKHVFQITSDRSCADYSTCSTSTAGSRPQIRSVPLCCCISPLLFSPWTSLPLHALVRKKTVKKHNFCWRYCNTSGGELPRQKRL